MAFITRFVKNTIYGNTLTILLYLPSSLSPSLDNSRKGNENHWSQASKWKVEKASALPCRTASAGIMISKGRGCKYRWRATRANARGRRGETDSPVPFVCPCTVGGVLRVGLTARIYILPARIFISVRGRVTSSMTGGRDALPSDSRCCLLLRASLRPPLRGLTPRPRMG